MKRQRARERQRERESERECGVETFRLYRRFEKQDKQLNNLFWVSFKLGLNLRNQADAWP